MNIYRQLLIALLTAVLLISVGAGGIVQAATADVYDADVAISWFDLQLDLAQTTPGFTPPVVSRAFAYSGVALYEAIAPGMPGYQSLAGQLNGLASLPQPDAGVDYDWRIVANSALYEMTHQLYFNTPEENQRAIEDLYMQWHNLLADDSTAEIVEQSVIRGQVIADAIHEWSLTDGGHQGQLSNFPDTYQPPTGTGVWIETPRPNGDPLPALQPYWGNNRSFALRMDQECALAAPPAYSEDEDSAFYAEALEVYEVVNNLTPEQEAIAMFWADDPGTTATPPGHSISILNQVLVQEDATLAVAAEAYAKMGIVQADSFILGWYYKFHYNLIRPVSYIHHHLDADWSSPVVTPPFPEYPSGHSVQSGAAAEILSQMFGSDYVLTDHTHDERGLAPRTFESFSALAEEAAISRLYGGIHYRAAIEQGMENGKCIGAVVNALPFKAE